jgi:ribosomal protein S18 acetylase RimI-like enzyme
VAVVVVPLRRRLLSPIEDAAWLSLVEIGSSPWEREVEMFLRSEALLRQEHGDCNTSLYLPVDDDRIVGFMSIAAGELTVDAEFRHAIGLSSRKSPRSPVGAAYIVAIGTDIRHRNQGYATQMHADLIESMSASPLAPRFVFLQVWEDSPAVRLYERWGYRWLSTTKRDRYGISVGRHKMVLDRFTAVAA